MGELPSSIRHPMAFRESAAAGFDGVFDWAWMDGCFGKTNITPMDFDGVVERKRQFLLFETKNTGVELPKGQLICLENLWKKGDWTVVTVWGKKTPETWEVWFPWREGERQPKIIKGVGVESLRQFVARWYEWADKGQPHNSIGK